MCFIMQIIVPNNQGYYVYKTSDGVTQATAGGLTAIVFGNYYTMTRCRDGNLYVRDPGANIYNLNFFGPNEVHRCPVPQYTNT